MIKRIGALACFFLVLAISSMNAQNEKYDWGLGIHPSTFSFYSLQNGVFDTNEYEPGVEFSVARYLNKSLDVGLEAAMAIVRTPDGVDNPSQNTLWRDNYYAINPFVRYKLYNDYILKEKFLIGPFIKAGLGFNKYVGAENMGMYAPFGLGLNVRLGNSAHLTFQSSYNVGVLNSGNFLDHSVGFVVHFGEGYRKVNVKNYSVSKADADLDGIADKDDACPMEIGTRATSGCPDKDGDGIADMNDRCPEVKGYANLLGCKDSDNDGLIDPQDKCPNSFGSIEAEGCPELANDKDKDGIADSEDACPQVPGFFTAAGCPDEDGDGVMDLDDSCPKQYGYEKYQGCPLNLSDMKRMRDGTYVIKRKVEGAAPSYYTPEMSDPLPPSPINTEQSDCFILGSNLNEIGQEINFDADRATILNSSLGDMAEASRMILNCSSNRIVILAHTDSDGDDNYNLRLSERRAQAVMRFFLERGVPRNRMSIKAMGESQPLFSNDTEENKRKNRRIEFLVR